ncbi:MAG: nickel pincer cofactor biosynthesis protein LarC [Planctomycetota bacterium]
MRTIYFDCFSGISGDMILGALVDAGLDSRLLIEAIGTLGLDGIALSFHKEMRGYLSGTRARVEVQEGPCHRHLPEILGIIRKASLSANVKDQACAVFQRLAEAEASVHGITVEKVHFHEVGALDAIVDVVGACAGLDLLGIDHVLVSPLSLGEGQIKCRHGVLPIPAPAVVRLVKDFEVRFTGLPRELTTPTGAAIITTLAHAGEKPGSMVVEGVGYGLGRAADEGMPNALRVLLGRVSHPNREEVVLLETNLDDITGEVAGYLIEQCMASGALDAFAIPIQMKKSRPGMLFSALTQFDTVEKIRNLIHRESGTLGIREQTIFRSVLPRESIVFTSSIGEIGIKKALLPDGTACISPEYEDAARIARQCDLPLREVMSKVMTEFQNRKL